MVNLLAAADELNMLKSGCSVHVEVQDRKDEQQSQIWPKLSFTSSSGAGSSGNEARNESVFRGKQLRLRIRDGPDNSRSEERYFKV